MGRKTEAYARGGAPWYWIVEPNMHEIAFLRLVDGHYERHGTARGREIYELTEPFPVQLRLAEIFP